MTKFNAAGSDLVYSAYVAAPAEAIALDPQGSAVVAGHVTSNALVSATPGAYDTTSNGGHDSYVFKLDPSGSSLEYATWLGGSLGETVDDVQTDSDGNAYVVGRTASSSFPTTPGAYDASLDVADAYVTKLNDAGSALVYSTLLGGSAGDRAIAVAVDGAQDAYVAGWTNSSNSPTTPGAFDTTQNSIEDTFVTKLNVTGSGLVYSTYLGGNTTDTPGAVALDLEGNAYIAGGTFSPDFPTRLESMPRPLANS